MKLEVGMYVRTKKGLIAKYIGFEDFSYNFDSEIYWFYEYYNDYIYEKDFEEWFEKSVVKTSHNIIDLIEVGDYVNGYLVLNVLDFNDNTRILSLERIYDNKITEEDIKSIVTKEQFESIKYSLEVNDE